MTITSLINWTKGVFIALLVLTGIVCFVVFCQYSFDQPVFFGIAVLHLVVTLFGGVWLCVLIDYPIDFPGTEIGIILWVPSLMLFHLSTYVILGLNVLGRTNVVLDWTMWSTLAVASLIITAVVGGYYLKRSVKKW